MLSAPFKTRSVRHRGFALVITLMLMILLTVIAVGLLGLASIALRTSAQGMAMATARANARLALMLAIGDLQKSLGPDKAACAATGILSATPAKPNIVGVWESWDYNPNAESLDYAGEKAKRFRCWLVSNADPTVAESQNFGTTAWSGDTIELVGNAALGGDAVAADKAAAGRVPVVRDGKVQGAYAWHVADESAKARINSYRDPAQNQTPWQKRALLAGHRPDPAVVKANDGLQLSFLPTDKKPADYAKALEVSGKLPSLNQIDLLGGGKRAAKFRNHVTLYSLGLPTNVREGGLKQDLSSIFGMSAMPAEYNNRTLYDSTHHITGISDPYWSTLKGYYDIFMESGFTSSQSPVYYKAPQEEIPIGQLTPPKIYYAAPVLAKVEILFSMVVRDSHNGWTHSEQTRMGHLLYAPIITLHNPYNVSLKFDKLDLDIRGIPMAFNFIVNDKPQNTLRFHSTSFLSIPQSLTKNHSLSAFRTGTVMPPPLPCPSP